MAHVPLVQAADAPLLARAFYEGGDPGPIVAALAHVPEMLEVTAPFVGTVLGPSALPARTKEIVILRTSAVAGCRFCVAAHTAAAREAGLAEEEVRALRAESPVDSVFEDEHERALVRFVDEAAGGRGPVPDTVRRPVQEHLGDALFVEVVLLVGTTLLLNRFATCLDLPAPEAEPWRPRIPEAESDVADGDELGPSIREVASGV